MRRVLTGLLVMTIAFSMMACGGSGSTGDSGSSSEVSAITPGEQGNTA